MDKLKPGTQVLVTNGYTSDGVAGTVIAHSTEHHRVMVAFPRDTDDYTFPESRIIVVGE